MASIADLIIKYLDAVDTTGGSQIQQVLIPDGYPILIGRGQNARTVSINGTLNAATDAEAQVLGSQLVQICSNDSEIIFIGFDKNQDTYDGFYIIESCRVAMQPAGNQYPFSLGARRAGEGNIGTYWGAFGLENGFSVSSLSIVGLPGGGTYTPSSSIIALSAEGGTVHVRENSTQSQGVYRFDPPTMPTSDFYIGQCIAVDDYGGVNPKRVYGSLESWNTGTVVAVNNGLIMWQFDQPTAIISLYLYDSGWIKTNDEIRFLINGETGKISGVALESISVNQVKWRVEIYDSTGLFATARFTLNKGQWLIKIELSTSEGVTIDDVEMHTVSGQTIQAQGLFNEAFTGAPGGGVNFDSGSNYGGALLDTNERKFGYAYTRLAAGDSLPTPTSFSYPAAGTSTKLTWGRTVLEDDSQVFGVWVMPIGNPFRSTPYPIVKVGRGLLGDANFNYVL